MPRIKNENFITRSYVIDKDIDQFLTDEIKKRKYVHSRSEVIREIMHKHMKGAKK